MPRYRCPQHPEAPLTPGLVAYAVTDYITRGRADTCLEGEVRCSVCTKRYLRARPTAKRLPHHSVID